MRTITLKYASRCRECDQHIARGVVAKYFPDTKTVAHLRCSPATRDYVDVDRMYEDQCADICGR